MRIDAHHHFWNYSPGEYGWIGEGMDVLKRDFGPDDLRPLLEKAGMDGVISVQARTMVEETGFLVAHGKRHDFIKGVVGWVDLSAPGVETELERFSAEPLVKGFRHVLQDEPDERYILRDDFNRGVGKLRPYDLAYDILIYHFHLPQVPAFVDRHEGQVFVIDHIAKPVIESDRPDSAWINGLREVAKRDNVFCKVSGLVTEVAASVSEWRPALLRPYLDVVLEAFGPDRLMFGSDWPVCLLRSNYQRWVETVRDWTAELSDAEQAMIWGGTAGRAYRLSE